jgi:plastocyanin
MRGRWTRTLALGLGSGLLTQAAVAGTVTGTVTYVGKVPNLRPLETAAEPICARKHATVPNEMLVLGSGNTMANVMVSIVKGLPPGKSWPAPATPVVMDQQGCQYVPHVMGIMVGQPFKALNNDGVLHNVHAMPNVNRPFNMAMPPTRKEATESFAKEEGMFVIKCDVHPWMRSYMGVFSHPFFAVTKTDGRFQIPNLPPGSYEIEAWHEKLGTQKASVTVTAAGSQTVDFKFSPPAAK